MRYKFTRVNPGAWPFPQRPLGAANMSAAWVRFAGTGDPNGGDLPGWPQYRAAAEQRMAFGDTISAGLDPNRDVLDAYDRAFTRMRRAHRR